MRIEKLLDKAYNNLKKDIQKTTNSEPSKVSNQLCNNKIPDIIPSNSELLGDNINGLCIVNDIRVPCNEQTLEDFYNYARISQNMIRHTPPQSRNDQSDDEIIRKKYKDGKSCRFRGTYQDVWLDKSRPHITIDSDGFCVLKGAYKG